VVRRTGFAQSDTGLAYGLAAWLTGEWVSDMHTDRTELEIHTQAQVAARVLEVMYG